MADSPSGMEPTTPSVPPDPSPDRARRLVTPRRVVLGGAPIVMTLFSRSALAWPQCSISRVLSGNLSQDAQLNPGETCAVAPECWVSLASTHQNSGWAGTQVGYKAGGPVAGYTPNQSFASVFGLPVTNSSGTWSVTGGDSLDHALKGGTTISFNPSGSGTTAFKITATFGGYSFAAQCACAMLNAAAFSPDGHFLIPGSNGVNTSPATILAWVKATWQSKLDSNSNGTNGTIAALGGKLNSSLQGIGAPCSTGL
jgi:hypothetical protein